MGWHDERAVELEGKAMGVAMQGRAGSIEHSNLVNGAAWEREQAGWAASANAPPPMAAFHSIPAPATGVGFASSHDGGIAPGAFFAGLFKWLLILAVPAAIVWAAFSAAVSTENQWIGRRSGGGFGRFAAAHVFPGEALSPASRYAHLRTPGAQFYACQLEPHCADFGHADSLRAAAMLAELAKGGDEAAARDMCLMPLLAGSGNGSIEQARFNCKWALRVRPDSAQANRIDAALNGSPWMSLASLGQGMVRAVK